MSYIFIIFSFFSVKILYFTILKISFFNFCQLIPFFILNSKFSRIISKDFFGTNFWIFSSFSKISFLDFKFLSPQNSSKIFSSSFRKNEALANSSLSFSTFSSLYSEISLFTINGFILRLPFSISRIYSKAKILFDFTIPSSSYSFKANLWEVL